MLKKLTTALGLTLIAGSLAFASQAPSTNSNQPATKPAATKPAVTQATPDNPQQQQATTSQSVKKHKKHHKKHPASNVTPKSSTPKQQ
jgi:apolipoprotein N-acyltransferase